MLAGSNSGASTYNVGAARFGTMRAVLESLVKHAGTGSRVISLPRRTATAIMKATGTLGLTPLGPYHWLMYGESMYFDIAKAHRELGWQPKYSNDEMFHEAFDWYVEHRCAIATSSENVSRHRSVVRSRVLDLAGWGMRWL